MTPGVAKGIPEYVEAVPVRTVVQRVPNAEKSVAFAVGEMDDKDCSR